ncbi:MAG: PDGLE domain-containing protein [Propionibacteriales bacterium]|nr:PDGLE domain-containing protein [Propionibacteriales bacterium]
MFVVVVVTVCLALAGVVSYYASRSPDGLNRVAADHGLDAKQKKSAAADSPVAGYAAKGVADERLSGGLAGVAGVLVVLVFAGGLSYVVRRRRVSDDTDGSQAQ